MPTSPSEIDQAVLALSQTFAQELAKFRSRLGRTDSWSSDELRLVVSCSASEQASVRLEFSEHQHCQGATLNGLLDEVYRRAGFDDREAGRLQAASAALLGLPAPDASADRSCGEMDQSYMLYIEAKKEISEAPLDYASWKETL